MLATVITAVSNSLHIIDVLTILLCVAFTIILAVTFPIPTLTCIYVNVVHPYLTTIPVFTSDGRSPVGAYLVLNLHDELVYEVTREHLLSVARMIKLEMENVMQLSVMLPVKVKVGPSWGTLEEYQFVEWFVD